MAISNFDTDLNIIQKLPDSPGLPVKELQAMFDRSGLTIQQWINTVLIPAVNAIVAVTGETDKTMTMRDVPADAQQVGVLIQNINTAVSALNTIAKALQADGSVTTEKIADKAVTPAKLSKAYFASGEKVILTKGVHYFDTMPSNPENGRLIFVKVT